MAAHPGSLDGEGSENYSLAEWLVRKDSELVSLNAQLGHLP